MKPKSIDGLTAVNPDSCYGAGWIDCQETIKQFLQDKFDSLIQLHERAMGICPPNSNGYLINWTIIDVLKDLKQSILGKEGEK